MVRSSTSVHTPLQKDPRRAAALTFSGVSHAYCVGNADIPVLDGVTLSVGEGEFVAMLGPSGCGKSTLLRLASGLELPTVGRVIVDGRPINGTDPSRILVFQDPTLFPWRTVRQNVALGPQARGTLGKDQIRVEDSLRLVKLQEFGDVYPHQLSGGMAQRAALARALVNDPQVLLLDEPLGRLDALTRLSMQQELYALWQRARFTVVLVTHDVEEALLLAQRVIVLSDRPARIVSDIVVDLPYPRRREDAAIVQLRRKCLETLGFAA